MRSLLEPSLDFYDALSGLHRSQQSQQFVVRRVTGWQVGGRWQRELMH